MVDFKALIKLINTNGDTKIQKTEVSEFLKTQNKSIYTDYFESIQSDVEIGDFEYRLEAIEYKALNEIHSAGNINTDLNFKTQQDAEKYEQIKQEIRLHDDCYFGFGWRFKSDEEFELAFSEALAKSKKSDDPNATLEAAMKEMSSKTSQKVIMERLNSGKFYTAGTDFQDIIFDDIYLSEYTEAFRHICFNEKTFANVSPEHLPAGFNPQEVLEKGKTIGLGIEEVHNSGYTGKGVGYAIIDSGVYQHNSLHYKDYTVAESAKNRSELNHFHGGAVSYIAQEIAPDADCYYYAEHSGDGVDTPVLENLKSILERNKSLPDDKKIRFVSMSMPLYGGEEAKKVVEELEAQGVWVYYSGCPEDGNMSYLEKIDPNGDPNDFGNYQSTAPFEFSDENTLYVNSGDRTLPDERGEDAFRHDGVACQSWSVPVIAGYYTLACQADPTMTKERFMELANKTARIQKSNFAQYDFSQGNEAPVFLGRTKETKNIKIIDIKALLEEIERQKEDL